MRVLLIGGTGTLSSDIAKVASREGIEIFLLNRGNKKSEYIDSDHCIVSDIRDVSNTNKVLGDMVFDVVIDFISFNPAQLRDTASIFNNRCKQYIFISSATVYSGNTKERITEDTESYNTLWKYAENKHNCETYLLEHAKEFTFEYTIVRPYITYGKTRIPIPVNSRVNQGTLIKRIQAGKPIILWEDGEAVCTLTNTDDFAKAMVGLFDNKKAFGSAFHITSGFEYKWKDVAAEIYKQLAVTPNILYLPAKSIESYFSELQNELTGDKSFSYLFDNSKIIDATGVHFDIPLEQGLKSTLAYYNDASRTKPYDYEWDARMDSLVIRSFGKSQKSVCRFTYYNDGNKFKKCLEYYICRNGLIYPLYKNLKKTIQILIRKARISRRLNKKNRE